MVVELHRDLYGERVGMLPIRAAAPVVEERGK
jgi:hypothetical protein